MSKEHPIELLVSKRTQVWLLRASLLGMLLGGALITVSVDQPKALAMAATLLVLVLAAVVLVLRARTPEAACGLCRATRAQVKTLVTGSSLAVCDQCAPLTLGVVTEYFVEKKDTLEWCKRILQAMPRGAPRSLTRPVIALMLDNCRDNAEIIRSIASDCARFEDSDQMADVCSRIAEKDRTDSDWIGLGAAAAGARRYDEALAATETALTTAKGANRALGLNNRAWIRAVREPSATSDELAALLQDLDEAKTILLAATPDEKRYVMPNLFGTEAKLLRALGDHAAALRALEQSTQHEPMSPMRHLIRAQILLDQDRAHDAAADLASALAHTHPESFVAKEANELRSRL
jgi:tetratricopeptide (TPR) repeat protein